MGKIRVTTIGDETAEQEQKKEQKKRKEAKRAEEKNLEAQVPAQDTKPEKQKTAPQEEAPVEEKKKQKKEKFLKKKSASRSKKYQDAAALIDKKKIYTLKESLEILPKLHFASFDETIELHINTTETGISGNMLLPHGTGKQTRVVIVNATKDPKSLDELVKRVEEGKIDFDVLIATPDSMPKLARVAKFLGPRGLMPNPKNGTITPKPEEAAKKFEGGQFNFKTEAKSPIIHLVVGKLSFGDTKLAENIKVAFASLPATKLRNATLKSTMSPGLKLDFSAI